MTKHASYTQDFNYTHVQPREKDAFGLDVAARMMLVPHTRFPDLVRALTAEYSVNNDE